MTPAVAQVGRVWRTVRWLKAEQVTGRIRFRLHRPRPDLREAPRVRPAVGQWRSPPERDASLIGPTQWHLLGESHDLVDIGWDNPAVALLWRYNQHYFDDLNAVGAADRLAWHQGLVSRWCDDNPPGQGTGWAPYPVSLRIVNWVKWFSAGNPADAAWLHSLAIQARWLTQRLERHLLGNHLFANAKALVFAGMFFDGPEADGWLELGLRILERELPVQFLPDGAQFERSPMYHALGLEDLLDLLNIVEARAPLRSPIRRLLPELRQRSAAALHWLRCLRHPGGALARFNDCAEGIAPAADMLERYAATMGVFAPPASGEGVRVLQPSGYVRVVCGPAVALLDIAPVGPDYLPGHAHADTLSFELSIGEQEIIVNRGTSVYGTGPRRQLERGTAAHSTVQVGQHDSSEVWAGFRVGRRARPGRILVDGWVVAGSHDGYSYLRGSPCHRRRWQFTPRGVVIEDVVEPAPSEHAVARFHLAPGLMLHRRDADWLVQDARGASIARVEVDAGDAHIEESMHAARFGLLVPAQTLVVGLDSKGLAQTRWLW